MKVEPLSGWNCLSFEQSKRKLSNPLEQLLALYFSGLAAKLSSMQVDHFVQLTACEIDKVRFEILNQNLVRCGALRVKAKNVDFFKYTVVFENDIKKRLI